MSEQGQQKDWRDSEPFDVKKYKNFFELTRGGVVVLALVVIGVLIFSSDIPGYWQNIYITGIGAVLTVTFLDRQAEQRATRQRKEELILQMGSPDNGFAGEAARLLRRKGWLTDGSLITAGLLRANLQGMDLSRANLQEAYFLDANLQEAYFVGANLQRAGLVGVNLQAAILYGANLHGVHLERANLQAAHMGLTNLQEAVLEDSNLQDADFEGAELNIDTVLPDGIKWTPDCDLSRFTDPEHPDFWRSDNPDSPAYRGKSYGTE